MKHRNLHKLAIIKGEARGYSSAILSKKRYNRKIKHPKQEYAKALHNSI